MDMSKLKKNNNAESSSHQGVDKINFQDGHDERNFKVTVAKSNGRKNSSKPVLKRSGNSKVASKAWNETDKTDRGKTVASRSSCSARRESSPESLNQEEEAANNKPSASTAGNAQAVGEIPNVASKPLEQSILKSNVVTGETSLKVIVNSESSQVKLDAIDASQDVQQSTSGGHGKGKAACPSREKAKSKSAVSKRKAREQPSESKGKKSALKRSKSLEKKKSQSRKRSGRKSKKSVKAETSRKRNSKQKQ